MRLPTHQPPTHPGEMLLEEFLNPLGLSQADFARHIGWTTARLNELIKGKRGMTPQSALDLQDVLGTPAYIWTDLQTQFDLWHARQGRARKKPLTLKKAS